MSVIHIPHDRKFVSIGNELARNNTLSFEARGVMLYLLSHHSEWEIRSEDIEKAGNIGTDKRRRIYRELEQAGYLSARRVRQPNGQLEFRIDAHEEPLSPEERTQELGTGVRADRSTENPLSGDPGLRQTHSYKKDMNEEILKEEEQKEEKPKKRKAAFAARAGALLKTAIPGNKNKDPDYVASHRALIDYHARRIGAMPDGGAQAAAAKWLLEHYSEADCLACYDFQLTEQWRQGRVSLLTVKKDIGNWIANGKNQQSFTHGRAGNGHTRRPGLAEQLRAAYAEPVPDDWITGAG